MIAIRSVVVPKALLRTAHILRLEEDFLEESEESWEQRQLARSGQSLVRGHRRWAEIGSNKWAWLKNRGPKWLALVSGKVV